MFGLSTELMTKGKLDTVHEEIRLLTFRANLSRQEITYKRMTAHVNPFAEDICFKGTSWKQE